MKTKKFQRLLIMATFATLFLAGHVLADASYDCYPPSNWDSDSEFDCDGTYLVEHKADPWSTVYIDSFCVGSDNPPSEVSICYEGSVAWTCTSNDGNGSDETRSACTNWNTSTHHDKLYRVECATSNNGSESWTGVGTSIHVESC